MTSNLYSNSTILVTGGTGSFGHEFVSHTLEKYNPRKLIIFSRDEMKQWNMGNLYKNDKRVRFFIGDVRDKSRLMMAFKGVDIVIHAAATKIVPTAEYNPFECIKTNVFGAMNVIEAAIHSGVSKVVALSTDKASSPINLYGASKLASDKLFTASSSYSGKDGPIFAVVRYGNVMGSRGSVIPFFSSLAEDQKLPVTDEKMTRFMITLEEGVELVWKAIEDMKGGETYVKKIPSMNILDICRAIRADANWEYIGIRPGEKIHEQMIGPEDAAQTYEYEDYYKILPTTLDNVDINPRILGGKKVDSNFSYTSDNNDDVMTVEELRQWISKNQDRIGKI